MKLRRSHNSMDDATSSNADEEADEDRKRIKVAKLDKELDEMERVGFCDRYGTLFDSYRPGATWFVVVDCILIIATGVLMAIRPKGGACNQIAFSISGLIGLYLLLLILFRPFYVPFRLVVYIGATLLQFISSMSTAAPVSGMEDAGAMSALLAMFFVIFASFLDIILTVFGVRRPKDDDENKKKEAAKKKAGHSDLRDSSGAHSSCASGGDDDEYDDAFGESESQSGASTVKTRAAPKRMNPMLQVPQHQQQQQQPAAIDPWAAMRAEAGGGGSSRSSVGGGGGSSRSHRSGGGGGGGRSPSRGWARVDDDDNNSVATHVVRRDHHQTRHSSRPSSQRRSGGGGGYASASNYGGSSDDDQQPSTHNRRHRGGSASRRGGGGSTTGQQQPATDEFSGMWDAQFRRMRQQAREDQMLETL